LRNSLWVADVNTSVVWEILKWQTSDAIAMAHMGLTTNEIFPANAIPLSNIGSIWSDSTSQNIYVTSMDTNTVMQIDMDNNLKVVAGTLYSNGTTTDDVLATQASLYSPAGITGRSDGTLFFTEYNPHRIRQVDSFYQIITTIISPYNSVCSMCYPWGLVYSNLSLFVSTSAYIFKINIDSSEISIVAGNGGAPASPLTLPSAGLDGSSIGLEVSRQLAITDDGWLYFYLQSQQLMARVDIKTTPYFVYPVLDSEVSVVIGDNKAITVPPWSDLVGICADGNNLYAVMTDPSNVLLRLDASGTTLSAIAGNGSFSSAPPLENQLATSSSLRKMSRCWAESPHSILITSTDLSDNSCTVE